MCICLLFTHVQWRHRPVSQSACSIWTRWMTFTRSQRRRVTMMLLLSNCRCGWVWRRHHLLYWISLAVSSSTIKRRSMWPTTATLLAGRPLLSTRCFVHATSSLARWLLRYIFSKNVYQLPSCSLSIYEYAPVSCGIDCSLLEWNRVSMFFASEIVRSVLRMFMQL